MMIVDRRRRIWIEREPAAGATFRVRLPRKMALARAV